MSGVAGALKKKMGVACTWRAEAGAPAALLRFSVAERLVAPTMAKKLLPAVTLATPEAWFNAVPLIVAVRLLNALAPESVWRSPAVNVARSLKAPAELPALNVAV